ncbi:hypothetical protein BofuT4_uP091530.1 [Botrytis cinerea T4]|uniref:Uncharacterized protein n=1 Tax=Botryotinia fuckeliana (strain T4) TaxID=999810 RepID=G2YF73_BOTF4|nr:hypothetical protein BofuT4_uP091530.1 [Botrytis cinerea T4]
MSRENIPGIPLRALSLKILKRSNSSVVGSTLTPPSFSFRSASRLGRDQKKKKKKKTPSLTYSTISHTAPENPHT